eukprot:3569527-Amphidinium_carterae.5
MVVELSTSTAPQQTNQAKKVVLFCAALLNISWILHCLPSSKTSAEARGLNNHVRTEISIALETYLAKLPGVVVGNVTRAYNNIIHIATGSLHQDSKQGAIEEDAGIQPAGFFSCGACFAKSCKA